MAADPSLSMAWAPKGSEVCSSASVEQACSHCARMRSSASLQSRAEGTGVHIPMCTLSLNRFRVTSTLHRSSHHEMQGFTHLLMPPCSGIYLRATSWHSLGRLQGLCGDFLDASFLDHIRDIGVDYAEVFGLLHQYKRTMLLSAALSTCLRQFEVPQGAQHLPSACLIRPASVSLHEAASACHRGDLTVSDTHPAAASFAA